MKWTVDHPIHQIIGDPDARARTRKASNNECLFAAFLSTIEPKTAYEALQDPDWSLIGSLMYLTASKLDIMFAVCLCALFEANPRYSHYKTIMRTFSYLKGTPNLGIWYPFGTGFNFTAFTNADHGGDQVNRKSTSGGLQFLGRKLVSWSSRKQNCISLSTAESEYIAAASCCSQDPGKCLGRVMHLPRGVLYFSKSDASQFEGEMRTMALT
ncbi:secreted RxLR effector protein 161-like [Rutidosis leptorrhynchoides]|uniref:secreted RxLR effector protein 161-like n=1 Tax=Rutidosis leptorrhynchoides TaxID=125765 RepID=UPI003A99C729